MNYNIRLNLSALDSAAVLNIQGKEAKKRCIVIPIEDNDMFEGEKGVYLDIAASEVKEPKYGDTHVLKVSLSKERYNALSDEEKKKIPIIGNMKPIVRRVAVAQDFTPFQEDVNDLPF